MKQNIIALMIAMALGGTMTTADSEAALKTSGEISKIEIQTMGERFVDITHEINSRLDEERIRIQEQINIKQDEIDSVIAENNRRDNVTFNSYNVLEPTGLTAIELYNTLAGINNGALADFAWALQECEEVYGINAFFLAGIIAHESAWVTSDRAIYQNNLTGHAVYNNAARGTYFNSQEESIYNTARLLYNNYLLPSGRNYHGVSVEAVNTDYCLTQDGTATDYGWSANIISIANSFNNYYHKNIKKLKEVPEMDIDMDDLLAQKRKELVSDLLISY